MKGTTTLIGSNTQGRFREGWVDRVKVVACLLVFIGHFVMGLSYTQVIPENGFVTWLIDTLYTFHVPLFFLCSGYLYQKYSRVTTCDAWWRHAVNKLIALGIPFFCFSIAVWGIKTVLPGSGSNEMEEISDVLFISPTAPYWYLYALFFLFLVTLTFRGRGWCIAALALSVGMKIAVIVTGTLGVTMLPLFAYILEYEIWFVGGMCLAFWNLPARLTRQIPFWILGGIFVVASILVSIFDISFPGMTFLMGIAACTAVMGIFIARDRQGREDRILTRLGRYTMPIFLMHSVVAAAWRSVLIKLGVTNMWVHILTGIVLVLGVCIAAGWVMKRLKYPEFIMYPGKFIKIKKTKNQPKEIIMANKKLNGTVIVTYRCNARCSMCNRYKAPSKPEEEISVETIRKLPEMYFTNITGGEPFIREDLPEIVRELYKKSDRIVISTNGFFTDRIVALCKEFPQIGIRISIEGLEDTNNEIRGLADGYQKGYQTLKTLREMGMTDVGFGMTVQDKNAPDLVPLYEISNEMGMEFATASLHNSFYFVEAKNIIHDRPMVAKNFEALVNRLLRSWSPKKWMRAYFNHGLINYIYGQKRLLPCDMSFDTFFIDPYGDVMPCNGTKDKEVMGNLNAQTWDELWNSPAAEEVRKKVRCCDRDCWMIGSVSPAMHKYIWKPAIWVMWHKFKALFTKTPYSMYENKIVSDLRDGKVTKEELDKCSTCDLCATINDGLSDASREQLKDKSGEEIVDADIARQMEEMTTGQDA